MKYLFPLVAVIVLARIAWVGSTIPGMQYVFGVDVPYAALILFIGGFCWRVIYWAKSPVPFKIPTTCGQGQSMPWVKRDKLEAPMNTAEVAGRMFMEIVFFRSLWRNTKAGIQPGPVLTYKSTRWLWLFGILFHYSMLIILLRHLRLFVEPVPFLISALDAFDGLMLNPTPELSLYVTDGLILLGLLALLLRRFLLRPVRYISLANDYFPLFLLIGIVTTGISMRYFLRSGVDIIAIKRLLVGLATFKPEITTEIAPIFYSHLFLVSCLLAYFPFSKLMHMGGVFLSPTRNMANDSRMKRHINPWNPDIKPHSYAGYEDEFREDMVEQGIPVDKELPEKADD
ncbi:MAG: sulfate reduction electron transfer complex DsrMKJOP subunit DsrM [Candidatus Electrothrix sp. Rat3]|nr:sulfate reduction electron transfer complex DsrMKJOP subunit DsrM [Candidatus Electrothrix rattekaaiensis]